MEYQSNNFQPGTNNQAYILFLQETIAHQQELLTKKDNELVKKDDELAQKNDEIIVKEKELAKYQVKLINLQSQVDKLTKIIFGRKSEKVIYDDSQPSLPGMEDIPTENEPEICMVEKIKIKTKVHHNAGWNKFPKTLKRVEEVYELSADEIGDRKFIGYEISEVLVKSTEYYVKVIKRAKYADPKNPLEKILIAPAPKMPKCIVGESNRCHYDPTFVVNVISKKLVYHIPFDRQSKFLFRQDINCSRSVMCDWFGKVAHALERLYNLLVRRILVCPVIHADETSLRMQFPGGTKTCWMWVRKTGVGTPMTAFYFAEDRSAKTAREILGSYRGTIIRDGYAAYDNLPAEAAGCWAHARRKFFEAKKNHQEYANRVLNLIHRLYEYEKIARDSDDEKITHRKRKVLRKKFSSKIVDEYFAICRDISLQEPPQSPICKAAAYSLAREKELCMFLKNPQLNIDNNPCENIIRPLCVGRKNWLFVGNAEHGGCLAILESFAATCKDNGIDFEKWLLDTIYAIDDISDDKLETLLPIKTSTN